jgi:hypothetical protein
LMNDGDGAASRSGDAKDVDRMDIVYIAAQKFDLSMVD